MSVGTEKKPKLDAGEQAIPFAESGRTYAIEALMKEYKDAKAVEYDWGAPVGKEMW